MPQAPRLAGAQHNVGIVEIDRVSYDKAAKHPARWGYQARGGAVPSSIVIHTTSNKRATAFETEARFLLDSPDVSAHYLIGKDARIVQFLSPATWQAWHAGVALPAYLNAHSIGIEHHVSLGETWTAAQHAACTWLVRQLMAEFGIASSLVNTHRAVALPAGRKKDPTGWEDLAFYAWRDTLNTVSLPNPSYRAVGLPIYHSSMLTGTLAGHLKEGELVSVDARAPLPGYAPNAAHLSDGRGFVDIAGLEPV